MHFFYTLFCTLLSPFLILRLLFKSRRQVAYRQRIGERFGFLPSALKACDIWFHAVSFGEVEALRGLVEACLKDYSVCITTMTPTGSERVSQLFGERVQHAYVPYELPWAINRFLKRVRPRLAVVMETEIWPNLYRGTYQQGIAIVLANARLSKKSTLSYQRIRFLILPTLAKITLIMAQTENDKAHFCSLGVAPRKVKVTGNLKFDIRLNPEHKAVAAALKERFPGSKPIWIAASTHPGEEELVLKAFLGVKQQFPQCLCILAPRHPERANEILSLIESYDFRYQKRSDMEAADYKGIDVLLLDTLGELMSFYAMSDVAFVGGSLVAHGGHNVLEPIASQIPVICGPHMHNFKFIQEELLKLGGLLEVTDSEDLAQSVMNMLKSDELSQNVSSKAFELLKANQGALVRQHQQLKELLANKKKAL